jgi:MFS family permease
MSSSSGSSSGLAPSDTPAGTRNLLKHIPFVSFVASSTLSRFASQMATVAIGWQIYDLTGSAFSLGMAGLVQFLPTALLVLVAGHAADRYDRKRVMQLCQCVAAITAAALAVGSLTGHLTVTWIFIALAVFGTTAAFESPASAAILPAVAPEGQLQQATSLEAGAAQVAIIAGPAFGGVIYALAPAVPYLAMAVFWIIGALCASALQLARPVVAEDTPTRADLFGGVRFVRDNPVVLGLISLDLFAVLFGGATALLPIYARDILHTGPWGLGVLRAAPAVGALIMTAVLARYAIKRRAGMRMFQAVIVFGAATMVFALSQQIWLSLLALAVMGAADTVSVVIRFALVQLATPDEMRGRVGAVNFMFVSASNELGEFESGITAALLGVVPAAVLGGLGTIAVGLLWMKLFPVLRSVEELEPTSDTTAVSTLVEQPAEI